MALWSFCKRFVFYWFPPLLWMVFIFTLSSQKSISATHVYVYDFLIFKTLHMIEYAVLYLLLYRAFHNISIPKNHQYAFSALIAVVFSLTDEFHQLFVSTRTGQIRDVFIDIVGMLIMYYIIRKVRFIHQLL